MTEELCFKYETLHWTYATENLHLIKILKVGVSGNMLFLSKASLSQLKCIVKKDKKKDVC